MLRCILGGVAGYAYVASLPDLKARPATESVEEKAEAKEEEAPASDAE